MANSCSRGHHLHVAGLGATTISHGILVRNGTLSHIGDDFHIAVGVWRKTGSGGNGIIIPDPD